MKCPRSEAAAFGELVHSLLWCLWGATKYAITGLIHLLYQGSALLIINGVLHLCLLKKDPQWLVRSSRPVMLEEPIKRKESSAVVHRLRMAGAARCLDPALCFTYGKEI